MPRIPEEELERIKKEIPMKTLAEALGVVLKGQGDNLIGLCPFHNDKEPSLVITQSNNLWNCLGACRKGGANIQWVQRVENVGFRHAYELLKAGYPAIVAHPVPRTTTRLLPMPFTPAKENPELLRQVIEYYSDRLKENPAAVDYLKKRGIFGPGTILKFQIGFADRSLGLRIPPTCLKAGGELRGRLQEIGILRQSGHEHFAGSVVFPILDPEGKILGVYGRKINDNLRPGTAYHTYLPGPHKGIWNPEGCQGEEVILCEAIIDALTFWQNGLHNVTASYGVNGFTPDHLSAFKAGGVKKVYIAYDRDEAGDKAAASLAPKLIAEGFECFRVLFPMKMDANEFALASDPPDKVLAALVRAADWLGKPKSSLLVADPPAPKAPVSEPPKEEPGEAARGEEAGAEPDPAGVPPAIVSAPPVPAAATEPEPAAKTKNSPAARKPASDIPAEITEREVIISLGDREYRVRGLEKNLAFDVIKVNLHVSRGELYHDDTLDIHNHKMRQTYITQAAKELCLDIEVIKADLGKVLFKLEELQEAMVKKALKPVKKEHVITEPERRAALDLLRDPNLLNRILQDFETCGMVGEETNKLACYLAAVSRKLEEPLAILIQSNSAAGKSALMEAVLAFMPDEEKIKYSAMTGQSLFYMGGIDLKNKILSIAEEEGVQKAGYALKLLQSEGELTIASTGKDPKTGRLVTQEYKVEGPVMIFMTTTGIDIDNELLNRCIVLTVEENRIQTGAIHKRQRRNKTLGGKLNRHDNLEVLGTHRNAQRLLRPLLVANPYADELTFNDDRTRTRRDHLKYLTLIEAVTLLHQYQRPIKTVNHKGAIVQYIDVTLEDIDIANNLSNEILGRSLDELPPQTRKLLFAIEQYVLKKCEEQSINRADFRFTRREIREHMGWTLTQTLNHMLRLEAMEYLYAHHGRNGQTFVYELVYNGAGKDGKPFYLGLADLNTLKRDGNLSGQNSHVSEQKQGLSATCHPAITRVSPTYQGPQIPAKASLKADHEGVPSKKAENAHVANPENQSKSKSNMVQEVSG